MENDNKTFERSFDSLEELADTISEALLCSVTIEDANHKLIAYSSHHDQTDPARISTIIGKRVPEKVVQALWRDGIIQTLMTSEAPVSVSAIDEIGLGDRVAISIRKDHNILGYIWIVLIDSDWHRDYLFSQLVAAAAAARTKLLQLQMSGRKAEMGRREFFRQLLAGDRKPDREVRRQAETLGLKLPAMFGVSVLPFSSEISEKQQQQIQYVITTSLQKQIVLHVMDNELLIMLEAHPLGRPTSPSSLALTLLAEQMAQRFSCSPLSGGCGSLYGDYSRVYTSYQEALTVIRLRSSFPKELKPVHYYDDLGFYRLLPGLLLHREEHHDENESIRKLQAYDREHNGELVRTLDAYLCHDSSLRGAADALHIHENTLSYRLKRIAAVGGIDLTRMDVKVTLYLELMANRLR